MATLQKLSERLDRVSEYTGRTIAWLTIAMVLVTFTIVILRYLFNTGWIAMQESVTYMHALVFMLGAAYTLKHDGHVRVDIFYQRLGPRGRAFIDLAGTLFLLLPVCSFILWVSWEYVAVAWQLKEGSPEAGGLPGVFLLKSAIPLMAGLMILQGISAALRAWLVIVGAATATQDEVAP